MSTTSPSFCDTIEDLGIRYFLGLLEDMLLFFSLFKSVPLGLEKFEFMTSFSQKCGP